MGRRKKRGDPSVTLFPFLSVLACVIGVLTLMITALAIGQMQENHDPRDKQRSPGPLQRQRPAGKRPK